MNYIKQFMEDHNLVVYELFAISGSKKFTDKQEIKGIIWNTQSDLRSSK